ncbi:hypothetical protein CAL26_22250 [Bordetella genomosp. 9]|uniref:Fido domain-containing protein n=1 Tax=Bordetella genomosp. 9 TaxID=1416803 RepID=A0A261R5F8_9BORD|nr:Fic family protein [Bordetella genomosp. 9]OZI20259.1 hypothetical protein CAL26_22250 [Bordetella genomosp. 9]
MASRETILSRFLALAAEHPDGVKASALADALPSVSRPTINRWLAKAIEEGRLRRIGSGPATYYLPADADSQAAGDIESRAASGWAPAWSPAATRALAQLAKPLSSRPRSGYKSAFLGSYISNESSLLGKTLAARLDEMSRQSLEQEPAGTYLSRILEPLLIDMSWSSSKLEGNDYSLADTRELFARVYGNKAGGAPHDIDRDAIMLLNHKETIQFMAQTVPEFGLSIPIVFEMHRLLMSGLLANEDALGAIRRRVVTIGGTAYLPSQSPHFLQEHLQMIVEKGMLIDSPSEAAFFLWVNIPYLQPFEDGNKRMGRLLANVPLILRNHAPLSFIDVDTTVYSQAMLAVYESNDVSIARDLFAWAYARSTRHYAEVLATMPAPDVTIVRWRPQIKAAVNLVVASNLSAEDAVTTVLRDFHESHPESGATGPALHSRIVGLVNADLSRLEAFNASRYGLSPEAVERWKSARLNVSR